MYNFIHKTIDKVILTISCGLFLTIPEKNFINKIRQCEKFHYDQFDQYLF